MMLSDAEKFGAKGYVLAVLILVLLDDALRQFVYTKLDGSQRMS